MKITDLLDNLQAALHVTGDVEVEVYVPEGCVDGNVFDIRAVNWNEGRRDGTPYQNIDPYCRIVL